MKNYKLYTDGSLQADAQIAGIGGYLLDPDEQCIFEFSEQIHEPSLFKYHESIALIYGLKKALEYGITHLECFADDVSIRNVLNKEVLSEISSNVNPFRKEMFALKKEFTFIHFHHLLRTHNKKADKLAGKILRIYNEEILPNRTRIDFVGQEDKFLHLPQLVCEEDYAEQYQVQKTGTNYSHHDFCYDVERYLVNKMKEEQSSISQYYLLDIFKNGITVDNIDDNNPIKMNVYSISYGKSVPFSSTLIGTHEFIQRKLTSRGLEVLVDIFNQHKDSNVVGNTIGLIIHSELQPLQKLDMLLRKRGILPLPNTPLTRALTQAASHFEKIVLHNDPEIILKNNQLQQNKNELNLIIKNRI